MESEKIANEGDCGFCGALANVKCSSCKTVFYCDRNCQKRHWKQHKRLCQRPSETDDKCKEVAVEPLDAVDVSQLQLKVEVREKSNGTFGVFTSDYVKKGELLCFYDGLTKDANTKVRLRKDPKTSFISIVDADQVFSNMLINEKCLAHPTKRGFVKMASENRTSFGIGQWICDFAQPRLEFANEDFAIATEELHKYQKQSLNRSNCQVNESFWFTASCNLESGSELFVHYGFQYWLKTLMLAETKDPEKRFFYYSLHDQSTQVFNLQKFYEYDNSTCITFLKTLILMPTETIDKHPDVKELLFELTMKNIDHKK